MLNMILLDDRPLWRHFSTAADAPMARVCWNVLVQYGLLNYHHHREPEMHALLEFAEVHFSELAAAGEISNTIDDATGHADMGDAYHFMIEMLEVLFHHYINDLIAAFHAIGERYAISNVYYGYTRYKRTVIWVTCHLMLPVPPPER